MNQAELGAFDYMLLPLKRYAEFEGRSRRMEYWMFMLLQLLLYGAAFLLAVFAFGLGGSGGAGTAVIVLFVLMWLGLFIPNIAVTVRRFHDQDKSGWFYLLNFVPYIGGLIVFVLMCLEGTRGPNQYGEDPKDPAGWETVFG